MSRRTVRSWIPLLALPVVAALAGCSGDEPAEEATPLTPAEAVRAAEIDVDDLPAGFLMEPFQPMGSDRLRGEPSIELCWPSLEHASERERLARHMTLYVAPGGDSGMRYELVAYTEGGAELAMQEIRDAVDSCPDTFVPFPGKDLGLPAAKSVLEELPVSDEWATDSVAIRETSYFKGDAAAENVSTIVYQRRGDLLSILSFGTRESADAYLADVAALQGERLAHVDFAAE